MRYATMQLLTWGTIAGSVACAVWLATLGGGIHGGVLTLAVGVEQLLPAAPPQSGPTQRRRQGVAPAVAASAGSGVQPGR